MLFSIFLTKRMYSQLLFPRLSETFLKFQGRLAWIANSTLAMYMAIYALISAFMAVSAALFLLGMDLVIAPQHNSFTLPLMVTCDIAGGMVAQMFSMGVLRWLLLIVACYLDGERKEDIIEGTLRFVQDVELEKGRGVDEKKRRSLSGKTARVFEAKKRHDFK